MINEWIFNSKYYINKLIYNLAHHQISLNCNMNQILQLIFLFVLQPCIELCISFDTCDAANASAADQSATRHCRFCVWTQSTPCAPSSCLCHSETCSWHPSLQSATCRTFYNLKWLTGQFSLLYYLFNWLIVIIVQKIWWKQFLTSWIRTFPYE